MKNLIILCLLITTASCSHLTLKHETTRQGITLDAEQVAAIKPGMTKQQVESLLGTPLLANPYTADIWEYAYLLKKTWAPPKHQNLVVEFNQNRVTSLREQL